MIIPIKTLYDLKLFLSRRFCDVQQIIIFIHLRGMELTRASLSSLIMISVSWSNLRRW
jgi:hypothetical protein